MFLMLVLIDPTFPWLLVYELHLQNRILLIAYYYHILLLNIDLREANESHFSALQKAFKDV